MDQLREILDRVDIMMRRRRDKTYTRSTVTCLCDPRINLSSRELSTFTRLRALCHLDLDLSCVNEVIGGNTETSGSDLLDRTHLRIAVSHSLVSFRILTTFTGVGLTAKAVHRDRQCFVSFLTDGTVGHSTCLKALNDILNRLDFVDGDRLLRRNEFQKTSDGAESFIFFVQAAAVFLKEVIVTFSDCILQLVDGLRIKHMVLAVFSPLVYTTGGQTGLGLLCLICRFHTLLHFFCDLRKTDTADTGCGRSEVFFNDFFSDTQCLKDLGTLVTLDCRDTHLGKDLHDTMTCRVDVVIDGNIRFLIKTLVRDLICDRRICHVRVDGGCTVTDQQCEVMYFSRLTGLQNDGSHVTLSGADEMLVQTGHSQKCRNRALIRICIAVGKN